MSTLDAAIHELEIGFASPDAARTWVRGGGEVPITENVSSLRGQDLKDYDSAWHALRRDWLKNHPEIKEDIDNPLWRAKRTYFGQHPELGDAGAPEFVKRADKGEEVLKEYYQRTGRSPALARPAPKAAEPGTAEPPPHTGSPQNPEVPATHTSSPHTGEVSPSPEVPVAAEEGGNVLGRVGKVAGPVALAAPAVIEGFEAGYHAHKEGKGAGGIAKATAVGAGKGVKDTYAPSYADVVSHGHRTIVDRALNAIDHASATTTAVGATATLALGAATAAETAGIVTIPAAVATGLAAVGSGTLTAIAGAVNVGDNLLKAGLKVSHLSGQDQDGGYVYNGIAGAYHLAEAGVEKAKHLVSGGEPAHVAQSSATTPVVAQSNLQRDGKH